MIDQSTCTCTSSYNSGAVENKFYIRLESCCGWNLFYILAVSIHHKNVQKNQFSFVRFCQATWRLLKYRKWMEDPFKVTHSSKPIFLKPRRGRLRQALSWRLLDSAYFKQNNKAWSSPPIWLWQIQIMWKIQCLVVLAGLEIITLDAFNGKAIIKHVDAVVQNGHLLSGYRYICRLNHMTNTQGLGMILVEMEDKTWFVSKRIHYWAICTYFPMWPWIPCKMIGQCRVAYYSVLLRPRPLCLLCPLL